MIVLHIGLHKCASSFLQSLMLSNAKNLRNYKIDYIRPLDLFGRFSSKFSQKLGAVSGNCSLPLYLLWNTNYYKYYGAIINKLSRRDLEDFRKHVKSKLFLRISENERSNIITVLSAEELSHESMSKECVNRIVADLLNLSKKLQVVALTRSIPDFIGSLLQQNIKMGGTSVKITVQKLPALFSPRLAHWKEITCKYDTTFNVELIDKLKTTEIKLEEHFLRFFCSDVLSSRIMDELIYKGIAANSRFDLGSLMILAKVNELTADVDLKYKFQMLQFAKRELAMRPDLFDGFPKIPYRPSLSKSVSLMSKASDEAQFLSQLSKNHSRYPLEIQDVTGHEISNNLKRNDVIREDIIVSHATSLVKEFRANFLINN